MEMTVLYLTELLVLVLDLNEKQSEHVRQYYVHDKDHWND
jgi:hypothetical protein